MNDVNVFDLQLTITAIVQIALLAVAIFAFINSLLYSAESYVAAGKLTKPAWCAILGIGVVLQLVPLGIPFIGIAMIIAAFVYLADVRPALSNLRRR